MRKSFLAVGVLIVIVAGGEPAFSQRWSLGGNMGLSLLGGSPGFQMTPHAEVLFSRSIGVGSEFGINTQSGAPLLLHPYFKYYVGLRGTQWRPYASAGPLVAFNVPNGPCFGFLFGSGVNIPVTSRVSIVPNILLGPVFGYGGGTLPFVLQGYYWGIHTFGLTTYTIPSATVFAFSVRVGMQYEI